MKFRKVPKLRTNDEKLLDEEMNTIVLRRQK
jgi:hypothetical protein